MNRWIGRSFGLVAAAAVAVSACGNAGTSTAGQTAETNALPAAPAGPTGAAGTVAAVTASSLQVQNPRIGQVTVTFTPLTSFTRTVAATAADLVVGDCALAVGAPSPAGNPAGPVTATQTTTFSKNVAADKSGLVVGECVTALGPSDDTGAVAASSISIRQPGPNGCQAGFGGSGRSPGRAGPAAATTGGNGGVHGA